MVDQTFFTSFRAFFIIRQNTDISKNFSTPKIWVRSYCPKALRHFSNPPADSILSRRKKLFCTRQNRCSFFKSQPLSEDTSAPQLGRSYQPQPQAEGQPKSRHHRFLLLRRSPHPRVPHCLVEVGAITPPRLARQFITGAVRLAP